MKSSPDEVYDVNLERIAFGSCHSRGELIKSLNKSNTLHADGSTVWDIIASTVQPQAFLWSGDAIYPPKNIKGDTPLSVMQNEYQQMMHNTTLGYAQFRQTKEPAVLGTWDDHDYGGNDRGRELTEREERRDAYLNFLDVPMDSPRWERKGVYSSIEFVGRGQDNNIVKVIFLDTRWHRERHCVPSVGSNPYVRYGALVACLTRWITAGFDLPSILPNSWTSCTKNSEMLGEEQWTWLERQLNDSKASMHIVISSIQVLTTNPVVESWGHFPNERERLLRLLNNITGLVILSGHLHHGEISTAIQTNQQVNAIENRMAVNKGTIVEVTSSGLTHSCSEPFYGPLCAPILNSFPTNRFVGGNVKDESLPSYYTKRKFGSIDIDWRSRSYNVNVHDSAGDVVLSAGFDMNAIADMSNEDIRGVPACIDGHLKPYAKDVISFYLAGLLIFCLYYFYLRALEEGTNENAEKSKKD